MIFYRQVFSVDLFLRTQSQMYLLLTDATVSSALRLYEQI